MFNIKMYQNAKYERLSNEAKIWVNLFVNKIRGGNSMTWEKLYEVSPKDKLGRFDRDLLIYIMRYYTCNELRGILEFIVKFYSFGFDDEYDCLFRLAANNPDWRAIYQCIISNEYDEKFGVMLPEDEEQCDFLVKNAPNHIYHDSMQKYRIRKLEAENAALRAENEKLKTANKK